ncbi:hypothetical protein C8F01DRAFT_1263367 [Mycena amicta]|nr:hypothetical protein C8F01DRAFT_1263367 [Mycena amicta]
MHGRQPQEVGIHHRRREHRCDLRNHTQNTPSYGLRVTSLKFSIHNSKTGITRTAGPFGGVTGTPFNVNVSGEFIALSGFAIDTKKSRDSSL